VGIAADAVASNNAPIRCNCRRGASIEAPLFFFAPDPGRADSASRRERLSVRSRPSTSDRSPPQASPLRPVFRPYNQAVTTYIIPTIPHLDVGHYWIHTQDACGVTLGDSLENSSSHGTLLLIIERPHLRDDRPPRLLNLLDTLGLSTAICTPSLAGDLALLSLGPRMGFGRNTAPHGERAHVVFHPVRRRRGHHAPRDPGRSVSVPGDETHRTRDAADRGT